MGLGDRVSSIVKFLRDGYPTRARAFGYIPLLALLPSRVTDEEITAIVQRFSSRKRPPTDNVEVGVAITQVTDEMPSLYDIERVQHRIAASAEPDKPSGDR
ncbi:DUF3349 domain-containing protein [Mycobacterium sp. Aquia_213]|uniref:DUF3349 domain-containing protein n=1 Tax=Mycobacterium sp. Aquia_213 TaxID=2991728 RepID=UPI00226FCE6E|nr:DUF3349 domain-containing protein [Mycobacterium sp. Aquia_213]WAC90389.1 DUF3349 domain-containing protein [Mycobacterium sp. Aquia_213]